jgi:SHS2 domain-containing protein
MKNIVFLDHTADVMFEASGSTLGEAFENCALALFSVTAHLNKVKGKKVAVKICEKAQTLEELFAFALNDLVGESDAREVFFKEFKVKKIKQEKNEWVLEGTAFGCEMKPEAGNTHVKSVTFHEASVEKKKGKWKARILLDI